MTLPPVIFHLYRALYVFISFMSFMTCFWDRKHYVEWDEWVSQKQTKLNESQPITLAES